MSVNDVLTEIWKNDSNYIHTSYSFDKNKEHDSEFLLKVNSVNDKRSRKPNKHFKLLKLYRWNKQKNRYFRATNEDLIERKKSYKLVYDLLDNYESDQNKPEVNSKTEGKEIKEFLDYIIDTKPIELALDYLNKKNKKAGKKTWTKDQFKYKIKKLWFFQYDWGKSQDLSGFEHTFVGERVGTDMKGYHFWYSYFLDDGNDSRQGADNIEFSKRMDNGKTPDYVAVRFKKLEDLDGDGDIEHNERVSKSVASFFNGCSVESIIAMGTVTYYELKPSWKNGGRKSSPQKLNVEVNGNEYKLTLHKGGPKNAYIRTFFPEQPRYY